MLILGQNGEVMVNVERIHTISTYQLGNMESISIEPVDRRY